MTAIFRFTPFTIHETPLSLPILGLHVSVSGTAWSRLVVRVAFSVHEQFVTHDLHSVVVGGMAISVPDLEWKLNPNADVFSLESFTFLI